MSQSIARPTEKRGTFNHSADMTEVKIAHNFGIVNGSTSFYLTSLSARADGFALNASSPVVSANIDASAGVFRFGFYAVHSSKNYYVSCSVANKYRDYNSFNGAKKYLTRTSVEYSKSIKTNPVDISIVDFGCAGTEPEISQAEGVENA